MTRAERRSRTREQLLEAARKVFARRGFHSATLDDVAEEAGYTKGAVYSNFAGKEDLFLSLLEAHLADRLEDVQVAFDGAASVEDVRTGARRLAELIAGDRDLWLLTLEFWAYAAHDGALRRELAGLYQRWRSQIGRLVAEEFDRLDLDLPADPEVVASTAIALVDGLAVQQLFDRQRIDAELYGDALGILVVGMAASGAGLDLDRFDRSETRR